MNSEELKSLIDDIDIIRHILSTELPHSKIENITSKSTTELTESLFKIKKIILNEPIETDREYLKLLLSFLTPAQQHNFRRMYSPKDLNLSLSIVVDNIPDNKIDWALQQVKNTKSNVTYT